MIKAILFDLGGVLFTNGTKKFNKAIASRYNLDDTFVQSVSDGEIGTQYREAQITRDEFWKYFLEGLKIREDPDVLEKEWISYYELIEGTRDIIRELSKKYKIYYLSDNVKERVQKLDERFGFLQWFDGGTFSHEVGVRKPNPKIYEFALHKAGVAPSEAVFIDDKKSSLIPAADMGMTVILFESSEKLRSELVRLHIVS